MADVRQELVNHLSAIGADVTVEYLEAAGAQNIALGRPLSLRRYGDGQTFTYGRAAEYVLDYSLSDGRFGQVRGTTEAEVWAKLKDAL